MSTNNDATNLDQLRAKAGSAAASIKADISGTIDDLKETAGNAKNSVAADLNELMQAAKTSGRAELAAAADRLALFVQTWSDSAVAMGQRGKAGAQAAMDTTDTYVKDNPWQAVAIGAGVGALLGFAIGCTATRR